MERLTPPVYDAKRVAELLGIDYSKEELARFGLEPAPLDFFVTFFDPGLSILELIEIVDKKAERRVFQPSRPVLPGSSKVKEVPITFYDYEKEAFAKKKEGPRYRRLRMQPALGSMDQPFAEQKKRLSLGENVPLARVVIMATGIWFLANRPAYLFEHCYVRCLDVDSKSNRVKVGGRGYVGSHEDSVPSPCIGLAAELNLPS